MTAHPISLSGCTPEPLMNYLKALGVFRLVSEQADPQARGCWRDDLFCLHTGLSEEALIDFFLTQYQPTPLFSPWNGDGGFLTDSGTSHDTIKKIEEHRNPRLTGLKRVIATIKESSQIKDLAATRAKLKEHEKQLKLRYGKNWKRSATEADKQEHKRLENHAAEIKDSIIFALRGSLPDQSLLWMDACMVVDPERFFASPILGSGGCDGRMEFSANFLANLLTVLSSSLSPARLRKSVLDQENPALLETSIGQFAPGRIGGPNATHGLEGSSMLNPWDYVLMMEGVVLFAGAVCRRMSNQREARAAFPFTVQSAAGGNTSLGDDEARQARGEIWLPLWHRATLLSEVAQIFAEGRAEWGGRQSRSAVDFSRAVASLGVDRGIQGFNRFGFLKRNGLAFIATSLGRFEVQERAHIDLLREIDPWLDRFRLACAGKNVPPRFKSSLRQIDRTIFDFCRYGGPAFFQAIVAALGEAERDLAQGERFRADKHVTPIACLSPEWVAAADDGSPEFELALGLAGINDSKQRVGPLRVNLEPVDWKRGSRTWTDKDQTAAWDAGDLPSNLAGTLSRRIMDGKKAGCSHLSLASRSAVRLDIIAKFLADELDDRRIERLLWGLILIQPGATSLRRQAHEPGSLLPRAYALLKLLFLPGPLAVNGSAIEIKPEPSILPLLSTGRIGEACSIAARRLRASGLMSLPSAQSGGTARDREWEESPPGVDGQRLAAALLIPIDRFSVSQLVNLVLRPSVGQAFEPDQSAWKG